MANVLIVGDGPAGLSAALFLAKKGMEVAVFGVDKSDMHRAMLYNYLGIPEIKGSNFQKIAREQVKGFGASVQNLGVTGIEKTAAGFQVTLHRQVEAPAAPTVRWPHLDLSPRQRLALQYVVDHRRITNREYQKLVPDVSAETIRRDLSDLVHRDMLLRVGRKRATYYILKDASLADS